MSGFNEQFLYAVIIIALGYTLKRFNIIKEKDGEGLARIIFNLTLPALIIVSFSDIKIESSLFLLIGIAFCYGLLSAFVSIIIFRKESRENKGMLGMLVPGFNIGLFAYPLVEGIWGREGIKYFGMFDVGNAFIVFGLLYLIGSYYSSDKAELSPGVIMRKLTGSIPLMTYIIVCGLNIISIQLPEMVVNVSEIISVANMPLSFLLLGIYLNFKFDKSYYTLIIKVLTIRYVLGLTVGISLFFILPYDDMFRYTVLIGLMLPVSVSVLPYSVEFNYDQRFIGTVSNLTILITFFLLWVLMSIIS
ncbi:hypothetical protein SAMN05216232_0975 [Virgibacillus subterraneus]|uniref:Malonate transporter n=1 Tax=Virgibacillus subterraneus TaxID=621109 RepID=A0A1H9B088_9BACI|nr:AEC family transporter [Virgibacillus subterraneus]SEP81648.1 hypothetical protein SAMN05216232_0975 [Virgibacillus subterraneus]